MPSVRDQVVADMPRAGQISIHIGAFPMLNDLVYWFFNH